ncbi:MAG: PleD family two-component response regulator [Oleiphilaceae bacterium]
MTVSGGIAQLGDYATTESLIKEADETLYLLKESSRNKIIPRPE